MSRSIWLQLLLFGIGSVGQACVSTSSVVSPDLTDTTTSSTSTTTTTTPTTTSTTSSTTSITSTSTTSTTSITSTTITTAGSCLTCDETLLTTGAPTTPDTVEALGLYTFLVGQCIVPTLTCISQGGSFEVSMSFQDDPNFLFVGCQTATLPAGLIVCNDQGQWVSTLTGTVNPVVVCEQGDPAAPGATMC